MAIRRGDVGDLELVLAIQREASLAGLANVFPPDRFPYPEDEVRADLRAQLEDPRYIALVDDAGRGFVMVSDGWLQRLYVRAGAWGGGLARELHAAALEALREGGTTTASLWCLAENPRARRFYEKEGWRLNGTERVVPFPPHPLDLGYSIELVISCR
jgi:GNAT superfamily N-acetyltransferase